MNFLNLYHPQTNPANEKMIMPALMAQLDVHPSGDQEVAGLTPRRVGNSLSWR